MSQYFTTRSGRILKVGADGRRMFVGEDMILGNDMLLGQDAITAEAQEVAAARAAGGYLAQTKSAVPVAFFQMLPFSVDVPGNTPVRLQLLPQRTFRVDNLIVTSPEGPFFELTQWTVGQETMFVADGQVNCAAFSEGASQVGLGMRGFTANQGASIILAFENRDTEPHRLSGFLSGPTMMKIG